MSKNFDGYLDWLANGPEEAKQQITINVHGAVITGTLISEDDYVELTRRSFDDEMERAGYSRESIRQRLVEEGGVPPDSIDDEVLEAGWQSMYDKLLSGFEGSGENSRYIHLQDVVVRGPGVGGYRLTFWRGRLSSVDGFALGAPRREA
jgi:hypothetical protein